MLNKLGVFLKNWKKSYVREFGSNPANIDSLIEQVKSRKRQTIEQAKPLIKREYEKLRHIKGLGVRLLAGILAYAHPSRFPSLSKYLRYCGFGVKSSDIAGGRNRRYG